MAAFTMFPSKMDLYRHGTTRHKAIGYLLAVAIASSGGAIAMHKAAAIDPPAPPTTAVDLFLVWALSFVVTAVVAGLPFLLVLQIAAAYRFCSPFFYTVAGALAPVPVLIAIGASTGMLPFDMLPLVAITFCVPAAIGGFVYWLYMRRVPPMSTWQKEAQDASRQADKLSSL